MKASNWTKEETQKLLPFVMARDQRKCRHCGVRKHLTVHHIKPRSEGGENTERNLITLCSDCHDRVELGELKWVQYGFAEQEYKRRLNLNKSKLKKLGRQIAMYIYRDGSPLFIGYRYEL